MTKFDNLEPAKKTNLRVLSLFTGIGGIDLGFQKAGFNIVATLDIDPKTCATLQANVGRWVSPKTKIIEADITTIDPKDLFQGGVDFIIGGPPCQSFSAIGRRAGGALGTKDSRGELFEHYCRLLKYYKPKGFLFENVRGILYANQKEDWENVLSAFRSLGYKLKYRVLDAAGYGVAQHRERVFLVGYKEEEFSFPRPTHGPDSFTNREFISPQKAFQGLGNPKESKLEMNGGKYDELLADIPAGMNYLFYTKKMGHPKPRFAWRSKFSDFLYKASPDAPTKTLVAKMGRYSGPFHWENRRLSVKELKRLQGFPDNFEIVGSRSESIQQIGNSVVPHIAYYLALAVRKTIFKQETDVEVMPDSFKLSIDSRKGEKAARTRRKTAENTPLPLFGSGESDAKETNRSNEIFLLSAAYLSYKGGKVILSPKRKNKASWRVSFGRKGSHLLATLEKEKTKDAFVEKGNLMLEISFKDDSLPIRAIDVVIKTIVPNELYIAWDAINAVISQTSSYPSIHELYGHFTEPNPQFSMKVETTAPRPRHPLLELLLWSANFKRVNELHSLDTLEKLGFGPSAERDLVTQLRSLRFDIRTNLTNKQIPKGMFRICYPYTLPYERRSFVTINNI